MREPSLNSDTYLSMRHDLHAGELAGVETDEQAHRIYYHAGRVFLGDGLLSPVLREIRGALVEGRARVARR